MDTSDTETLTSLITNYSWENGRRYHAYKDGAYWGPNDELAKDLQDLAHHLWKLTMGGKLYLAPINNPSTVLDSGTGTGIWAIELADLLPDAEVVGNDLSPIQPALVPPNCIFEVVDVTEEWTYPHNYFDLIHIREMYGSIPDWDYYLTQTFSATKPGGYVELAEHSVTSYYDDGTLTADKFFRAWGDVVSKLGERSGKSFNIWAESKERIERAGFVDVVETRYKWPMNAWPKDPKLKELGLWNQLRIYDGVEGYTLRLLTRVGGWTYQRAQVFLAEMRKALKDHSVHTYLIVTVVYGRKPEPKIPPDK